MIIIIKGVRYSDWPGLGNVKTSMTERGRRLTTLHILNGIILL